VGVVDKSFLRLLTDFSLAKSEIMIDSEFIYNAPICLHPQEKYLQITNFNNLGELVPYNPETVVNDFEDRVLADGGTFEAYDCLLELLQIPFKAELIDCKENVLLDITDKVFYTSFNDINNAPQIAFEIQPIENDFYYEKCFLRLNFDDDNTSFYSNGFYVTAEDENKTFRIDYKNVGYYQGISYDKLDVYQSIRLFGYFNQPSTKEAVTIYTQLNGEVRRSRPIQAIEYKYNIDLIDTFTFERLSNALNTQIVYLNGNRFQTIDNVQSEERQGKSNMFATSFKGQFNYADTYVDTYQLIDPFDVISYFPNSIYTYFPLLCNFTFNYNLTEIIYVKLWNYTTETLIADLVPTGFVNNVTNDIEMFVPTLGKYYFTLKVKNEFGEYLEITNKEKLKFESANPDYSFIHYTNDYLTA
jgi:hypothetical protein